MTSAHAEVVERPRDLAAALALLDAVAPCQLLAGGTDLMVEWATGRSQPRRVVDLSRCRELCGTRREAGGLWLGARTTLTELLVAPLADELPLLAAVARAFAAPQIRNRATLGGNLATASPAGDLAPALLALGASVRLRSLRSVRDVPMAQFFTGYRRHAGQQGELIDGVLVPPRPRGERVAFEKVGTRGAQAIAKVALAVTAVIDGGLVRALDAAAGAVADRPLRLPAVQRLVGTRPDGRAIANAAALAATADVAPIDDVRSTARYRRHALQRLLQFVLGDLLEVR